MGRADAAPLTRKDPIIATIEGPRAASIMVAPLARITAARVQLVIIDLTGADRHDGPGPTRRQTLRHLAPPAHRSA